MAAEETRANGVCVCFVCWVEEEETDPPQWGRHSSGEETALLLPEHTDTILRYNLQTQTHINAQITPTERDARMQVGGIFSVSTLKCQGSNTPQNVTESKF